MATNYKTESLQNKKNQSAAIIQETITQKKLMQMTRTY